MIVGPPEVYIAYLHRALYETFIDPRGYSFITCDLEGEYPEEPTQEIIIFGANVTALSISYDPDLRRLHFTWINHL